MKLQITDWLMVLRIKIKHTIKIYFEKIFLESLIIFKSIKIKKNSLPAFSSG